MPLAGRASRTPPSVAGAHRSPDGVPPPEERSGRHTRARLAALAAILVVAAVGLALIAKPRLPTTAHHGTAIPAGETTTTVERRTLVEHAQLDGTLGYGGGLELYDRLAGTFTWLPAVGAVIGRGGALFRLDNLPVVLMYGAVPAYRTLKEGIGDGPDVAELNANLADLGFDPQGAIGDRDHFDEATAAAVRRWQQAEGLPQTGEVELGRVLFAPGARRVTAVHKALGDDPPGSSSSNAPSPERPAAKKPPPKKHAPNEAHSKYGKPKRPRPKADSSKTPSEKDAASKEPASKETASKGPASKEPASNGNGASPAAAPVPVLTTTATLQIVQLQVKATEQQLARVGEWAPVRLPNGDVVQGHITNVGTVATESSESEKEKGGGGGGGANPSGGGENATISVTLALERSVARLDRAPVSVELVKSIRRNVLAVPATALLATAGGGYAIEVLEGARRFELAVTPGMFANGFVQIEGSGVHAGLTVTEPQ